MSQNTERHVIKSGIIRLYRNSFLSKNFKQVFAELTQDSNLKWYKDPNSTKPKGTIHLQDVADYLAVGPYTRCIPGRPVLTQSSASERCLLAVSSAASRDAVVHWFICSSDAELNEWMLAICSTLPAPVTSSPAKTKSNASKDVQPTAISNEWGWTWGWGGGWGCPGWGSYSFDMVDTEPEPSADYGEVLPASGGDSYQGGDHPTSQSGSDWFGNAYGVGGSFASY